MKNNISIIGFMGTGKSAIGRNVARELDFSFVDLDRYMEEKLGMRIGEYFSAYGEAEFRKIEQLSLEEVLSNDHQVISTGGGIALLEENRKLLREKTYVVSLKANAKTIYYRVKRNNRRPLLRTQKPLKAINRLLKERRGLYDFGDLSLYTDNETIIELAKKIAQNYKSHILD